MLAVCKQRAESGATIIDAPVPRPPDHHALIKVKATSICGTDVHIYMWDPWAAGRIKPPLIFGHEFSGEVVEVGKGVERIRVGDHISCETHIPCGTCSQCRQGRMHLCQYLQVVGVDRPGCFAEYVSLPEICCVKNEMSLPWDIASVLEPFGNAVHCVSEGNVQGKRIAIFGDGPIGVFATAIARAYDPKLLIVCGMQPYRLNLMRSYHPDHVLDVRTTKVREAIMDLTGGQGVDVVLEMSGSERAIHDGLAVLRGGGTFIAFGVTSKPAHVDFSEEIIFKGIVIKGIFGRRMFETWDEVKNLMGTGRIDLQPVLTHTFPLAKIADAMGLLRGEEIQAGKIVLLP